MVIEKLKNTIVFLDTAPLTYFIEGHSEYQEVLEKLFKLNDENYFKFLTSSITLLEVLVKPLRDGETKIVEHQNHNLLLAHTSTANKFIIHNHLTSSPPAPSSTNPSYLP